MAEADANELSLFQALCRYALVQDAKTQRDAKLSAIADQIRQAEAAMGPSEAWFADHNYHHATPDPGSSLSVAAFASGIAPTRKMGRFWLLFCGTMAVSIATGIAAPWPWFVGLAIGAEVGGIIAVAKAEKPYSDEFDEQWERHETNRIRAQQLLIEYDKVAQTNMQALQETEGEERRLERAITTRLLELTDEYGLDAAESRNQALGPPPDIRSPRFETYAYLVARSELAVFLNKSQPASFHIDDQDSPIWLRYSIEPRKPDLDRETMDLKVRHLARGLEPPAIPTSGSSGVSPSR